MGAQIHGVSLATSAATASSSAAPLSLVAGPVSTAPVSGATTMHQAWITVFRLRHPSIHPSILTASFPFYPSILPFRIKNRGFWRRVGSWDSFSRCYQPHTTETGRGIWRRKVGGLTGGWRAKAACKHLQPGSVPIAAARQVGMPLTRLGVKK